MLYGEIINGKIAGNYNAKTLPPKRKGVEYVVYDTTAMPCVGDDVSLYLDVAKGVRKSLHLLVKEGLQKIPLGKKLNKEKTEFVDMTDAEKWEAGLLHLKPTQKIEGDYITEKTKEELYKDGLLSKDEFNEYIRERRESAYRSEADKLGLQAFRGEVEKQVWLDKVNEIKQRFPKV